MKLKLLLRRVLDDIEMRSSWDEDETRFEIRLTELRLPRTLRWHWHGMQIRLWWGEMETETAIGSKCCPSASWRPHGSQHFLEHLGGWKVSWIVSKRLGNLFGRHGMPQTPLGALGTILGRLGGRLWPLGDQELRHAQSISFRGSILEDLVSESGKKRTRKEKTRREMIRQDKRQG